MPGGDGEHINANWKHRTGCPREKRDGSCEKSFPEREGKLEPKKGSSSTPITHALIAHAALAAPNQRFAPVCAVIAFRFSLHSLRAVLAWLPKKGVLTNGHTGGTESTAN
jgi:hypothetical protein